MTGGVGGGGGGRIFIETQKNFVNYLSDGFKNIKLDGGAGSIEGTPGTLR